MFNELTFYAMTLPPSFNTGGVDGRSPDSTLGAKARILIVEDEFLVAMTIEDALLQAGHEIVGVVRTGEEAVQAGIKLRPDLVLMDIRLAGQMTGIEAAVELRVQGIKSLFASSHTDRETRALGENACPVGWLAKPFSESEVTVAVAAALARLKQH